MPVETPSIFSKVIQDHLELKQRNADLENAMPLGSYKAADPFDNHPLFKTEEQARLEETLHGQPVLETHTVDLSSWTAAEPEQPAVDQSLWSRTRDFDWGD
ncbi:MAG: hypothetical protein H0T39_00490 [Actinobacteria bacterium]|nr:hypothetical protein [Actinomycetota bacterium]